MDILFFSHYFPPEVNAPASRTFEHCKIWVKAGHKVTVVTCAPNHPKGQIYPGYKNRFFSTEKIEGIDVVRVWTFLAANEGFLLRILNYISYLIFASFVALRLKRPDVIVSTSPQFFCGLTGLVVKKLRCRPWVLEVRDLWPESIVTVGAMRKGVLISFLEWLERLAYRKADCIVSVTDSFVSHIASRGGSGIEVIKNGADLSFFNPSVSGTDFKKRIGFEKRFVVAYVGTHGMAHALDTVLDAARLLSDNHRIGFLLVGDGAEWERLHAKTEAMKLGNIKMLGQLPKSEMPMVWSATDASLIHLKRDNLFKAVIPSKMFEAMAMERPIVLGVEGEACRLLEEADAGIAITPENSDELAKAVLMLADNQEFASRLGHLGGAYVRENYDRAKLAEKYIELLKRVVLKSRGNLFRTGSTKDDVSG